MAARQQIDQAIERGTLWLKSKQNVNGSYGKWGLGSTGLAVMALLCSNVPNTDTAVSNAISYILNSTPPDSTYFRASTVMALIANNEKAPAILSRVQSDTEWLIQAQGSNPDDKLTYGGWGNSGHLKLADGSNTQYAMLALYSAALWGLTVPEETWSRAITWYQSNHDLNNNGSYVYSLGDISRFDNKGVSYAITSGALLSTKIINMLSTNPNVKSQAQTLLDRTLGWLKTNYTVELRPGIRDNWHYYYLFSLQKGCVIEPYFARVGTHVWYADIADYLVRRQKPDGKWSSDVDKESTEIVYTSLALLTLTGANTISNCEDKKEKVCESYAKLSEKNETAHGVSSGKKCDAGYSMTIPTTDKVYSNDNSVGNAHNKPLKTRTRGIKWSSKP